jgi:retinol dehydrogenase 12
MLYHANASRIYILGRSEEAGKSAAAEITSLSTPADVKPRSAPSTDAVRFIRLDLSDLSSVKEAAQEFLDSETRLDVLWHNAAIMLAPEGSKSKQGHELTFATNVLGPFLLQHLLTPVLIETTKKPDASRSSVRSCWASSGTSVAPPGEDGIDWDDWALEGPGYSGFDARTKRYIQSKAANTILAAEMTVRHPEFTSCAFNPGANKTNIARHASGFMQRAFSLVAASPRMGALTELYAGFAPEIAQANGCFIVPYGQIGKTHPCVHDGIEKRNSGERLWILCDKLVSAFY